MKDEGVTSEPPDASPKVAAGENVRVEGRSVTGDAEDPGTRSGLRWLAAVAVISIVGVIAGVVYLVASHDDGDTQPTAMAERAQRVMPFDLSRTIHTFTKTSDGGIQKVVVKDSGDTRDRDLIRAHLRSEARSFRSGNYSDPAKIHGMDMPGVDVLEEGASRVKVVLAEVPGGAQITYTSTEPTLVASIHDWFDRQASDHAMPGMGG